MPSRPDVERILCVMPLFHVYASHVCLHTAAYARGTMVILPRYHPAECLTALADGRITIFAGSPTIYTSLLSYEGFARADLSSLYYSVSGSAALPATVLEQWEARVGTPIVEGYGQSEAGPVLTYNPLKGIRKPGSVGVPVPDTEVQIVDLETGERVLPPGEQGEIRARGPQIMAGYRNLPKETAETLRSGWLYTGDIGEFDADGYLYIRDRKKEMVIVSGYNVFPREVEIVLYQHPAVREAGVIGVPNSYRGEIVKAFVSLKPGAAATTEELVEHCRKNLAKYKLPAALEIVADLPKTAVGKIDKKRLKAN
jgi:long-chain acyl-CoA synthetase